jgi:hypothetical protein
VILQAGRGPIGPGIFRAVTHRFRFLLLAAAATLLLAAPAEAAKLPYFSFGAAGTAGGQFKSGPNAGPAGMAVNATGNGPGVVRGDLYAVDRAAHRIEQFRANGTFVRAWGIDVVQTGKPNDLGTNAFEICDTTAPTPNEAGDCKEATSTFADAAKAGGMLIPQGIAVDPATGNVFVTDSFNARIDVFSANGSFQGAFGWGVDTGIAAFQFCTAASTCQAGLSGANGGQFFGGGIGYAALAPPGAPNQGNLVVADRGNRRLDEFSFTLNGSGEVTGASLARLWGWDVIPTGKPGDVGANLFEVCASVVLGDCRAGQTTAPVGNPGQFASNQPADAALDSSGAIYAVESTASSANKRRVHKFTPQVGPPALLPSAFNDPLLSATSAAAAPQFLALGPDDHLFVDKLFESQHRVLELDPAGNLLDTHLVGSAIASVNDIELDSGAGVLRGRLYVASGTSAGDQQIRVYIDKPTLLPIVATGDANPGSESYLMELAGEVNPNNFKVTGCRFEYGITVEYGTSVACNEDPASLGEGTSPVSVSAQTEPLEPNTTYHYRLVASNLGGDGTGEDRTFTTSNFSLPNDCPNAAIRAEQGVAALLLPDCMALEMVSPPVKSGAPAFRPSVSADGSRVSFVSRAALGDDPPGMFALAGALYVASRGGFGWSSEMTLPDLEPRLADQWRGSDRRPSFTPDFSRWFGFGATEQQLWQAIGRPYEAGVDGFFSPLSSPLTPLSFFGKARAVVQGARFESASADHTHLYFTSGEDATYLPGDPTPQAELSNVYLARGADVMPELLQRDRNGKIWGGSCGARLGGISLVGAESAPSGLRNQGAVSADGFRTYLSARAAQPSSGDCDEENKLRILERFETPTGPQIVPLFASECSRPALPDPPGPCAADDGDDLYQGASVDQSKVYFTTSRQLADSDLDGSGEECSLSTAVSGCDLYLYDRDRPAGHRLTQVSKGEDVPGQHEAGKEASVYDGITAVSGDGTHVYYVATGVLTDDVNPEGQSAQAGQPNLYLWDLQGEETSFLGVLDPEDGISTVEGGTGLWGGEGTWRNGAYPVPARDGDEEAPESGGDGHVLVFESLAPLTDNDADGGGLDVYRYESDAQALECLSCAPGSNGSEPDEAPFDVQPHGAHGEDVHPAGTDVAETLRWVSEDGEIVGFITSQPLVPGDVNAAGDFYLWTRGALARLPGGPPAFGAGEAAGPFLAHDGSTVAFATATPLLPKDGDTTADVYVARVAGGYPNPVALDPCKPGESCQPPSPPSPPAPQAASDAPRVGNPPPRPCPRGKVRRKGRCVKKRRARGKRHRHVNADRRAGK